MSRNARHVAVDLGASSGRVAVGQVAEERLEFEVVHRFDNHPVEKDGHLYWDFGKIESNVLDGLHKAAADGHVDSAGVDSWAVDYAFVDAEGERGEVFCYRDQRSQAAFEESAPSHAIIFERTGIQFLPFNTVFQLASESAKTLARADRFLMVPDLVHRFLCGSDVCEATNASTTQMLDPRTGDWDDQTLALFSIPRRICPPVVRPGTVLGKLKPNLIRPGLEQTVMVAPATHDTASAVAAVPMDDPGTSAYVSSGTWSLVGFELDAPVLSEAAREANYSNEGGIGGTTRFLKNVMGLWILQECASAWGVRDWAALTAGAVCNLSHTFDTDLPSFLLPGADMPDRVAKACRSAGFEPKSRAETVGAILASLAKRTAEVARTGAHLAGLNLKTIHVVGGGSQNNVLNQLIADASGLPVVAGPAEATLMGNLLVQAEATGTLNGANIRDVVRKSVALTGFQPKR